MDGARKNIRNRFGDDSVHSTIYTDRELFDAEMKKLFYDGWVFVGHESEVPKPNNYITRMIGREPVIMVRTREGNISVVSNRCAHRGNMLCHQHSGSSRSFSCEYHGWTFSHEGDLVGVPLPGGSHKDSSCLGLQKPAMQAEHRGFVFITFNPDAGPLDDHLGKAKDLIDRSVSLSPTGKIKLSAGWLKQRFRCNWKMLPENSTDGYHAPFTHASFLRVFAPDSQYKMLSESEDERKSKTVDWGNGHVALEHAPSYEEPLQWLGTTKEKVPDYVESMKEAYGEEEAMRKLVDGPPHSTVFPNLFLGEMNIAIFQPVSVDECVLWHTPMLLDGVSDKLNARILRQSQAAMGPASFLLADDAIISERQQVAAGGRGGWMDLSRGRKREEKREDGTIWGHISDETTNRGFWSHYREVMQA
ncbi:aromatic ring-hydroxylating dioxygenase subunit alpha [Chelativorans sp. AA-79]|uniref:aromatic ring-hydroxylating oxygenase subunit alpha n=1 Tax=Chelativorans sp. AA-79 TaxID=3028735 RepID=UPI0023F94899|nr:aromatic ring-hydroxylating dioxygenase subunit alpha [Chelativorans sp. AA-79]WEX12229.1 aromatic ring-hydroxylating dioxygenase subunit alpha [Chelativorans sp. AA-79]